MAQTKTTSPLASLRALATYSGTDPNDTSLAAFRSRMRARQEQDDQAAQDEYERYMNAGGSLVGMSSPAASWERMSRGGNVEQTWGPWLEAVQESAERQDKQNGGISLPRSFPTDNLSPSLQGLDRASSDRQFVQQTANYRNAGGKTRYL